METEEIHVRPPQTTQPTQADIEAALDTLNLVRLQYDQASAHLKYVRGKIPVNPNEIFRVFDAKQAIERKYMSICDWIWEYSPLGFYFDDVEQRYILR